MSSPTEASAKERERGRSPGWLSRVHRNNSSSKRSASPAPISDFVPRARGSISSMDGASLRSVIPEPEPAPEPPPVPAFLQLSRGETSYKFAELAQLESERLAEKHRNPSMDGQWARFEPDLALDRYSNIHPWANNRIRLRVPEGYNDYINASPITVVSDPDEQDDTGTVKKNQYICMQGPKRETVDDVWHMIWHELAAPYDSSPAVIIMLSPTHDVDPRRPGAMFEKCFPYFPVDENCPPLAINETARLGDDFKGTIRFVSQEAPVPGTELEIRKFAMTVEGKDEEKPIWHFLYPSWPDFGALEVQNLESLLSLMSLSREKNADSENPRVIHCSAGVGRTGTFVALEFLLGELQRGAWEGWDAANSGERDPVFDTVNQLRRQRRTMVQSADQYVFLYEVLKKTWEEKYGTPCVEREYQPPTLSED